MSLELQHELIYPNELVKDDLDQLVSRLKKLYTWYSPGATEEKIRVRITAHPNTEIDLFTNNGEVVAFGICVVMTLSTSEKCLFRHGTVIADEYRSQGLYRRLFALAESRHEVSWYATRTQNPRVYETWFKLFGDNLYPRPAVPLSEELRALAVEIAKSNALNTETFVARGVYKEDRTGAEYHQCREPWIQEFFRSRLGVNDAFLLLARVG